MFACDECPGSHKCTGQNLQVILMKVYNLYASGVTDKFDILFALGEENEHLLEEFDQRLSPTCWSKAALLSIADIVAERADDKAALDMQQTVRLKVTQARDAFSSFPWQLHDLVEHAPDLYGLISEKSAHADFSTHISKRMFVKICKDIAYN